MQVNASAIPVASAPACGAGDMPGRTPPAETYASATPYPNTQPTAASAATNAGAIHPSTVPPPLRAGGPASGAEPPRAPVVPLARRRAEVARRRGGRAQGPGTRLGRIAGDRDRRGWLARRQRDLKVGQGGERPLAGRLEERL